MERSKKINHEIYIFCLYKDRQLYCDSSIDLEILGVYDNIEIWNEHCFEEMTEKEKIVYLEKINHKNKCSLSEDYK